MFERFGELAFESATDLSWPHAGPLVGRESRRLREMRMKSPLPRGSAAANPPPDPATEPPPLAEPGPPGPAGAIGTIAAVSSRTGAGVGIGAGTSVEC
jgi:hypothetical protein